MKIQMPEKVKFIIETIQAAGFEAYAVGGCIRDSLLGRTPNDWDITTSARPEEVKALFRRTIDTGIQHGTVTVMMDKEGFEVTTYRIDGEYEDSRHPKEVLFTSNLVEDLKRRDFTINAMAYNDKDGLVDAFCGKEDLQQGIIRCVGSPMERFTEDALRIMRAIRFSAQLGYEIEEETLKAIAQLAPTLSRISAERIQVELLKLITSPHPEYLRIAYETGVTKVIFPEWDAAMETEQNHPHHCYNVGEHTLCALVNVPADKVLRLAILFHDIAKPVTVQTDEEGITHFHGHAEEGEKISREIMRRLRMDNDTIGKVSKLVKYHDYGNGVTPTGKIVRRAIYKVSEELFPLLLEVRKADTLAQSMYLREEKLANLEEWTGIFEDIIKQQDCVSLKTLAVTGSDLIAAGLQPGKQLGDTLNELLEMVLEDPSKNTKEILLNEALKRYSNP